jgi:hypothetical protein
MSPSTEIRQFLRQQQTRRVFLGRASQGLGALALGSILQPRLLQAAATRAVHGAVNPLHFPAKARRVIWLSMAGGPSHLETFDPKPAAPIEIRGPFLPIATSVPGLQFSELLPLSAARAHRMCVIRSMTTGIHSHSTSGAFMLTGHEPTSVAESVPPSAQDWPSLAGAVMPE